MSAGIFLIQQNGELVEMAEHAYDSEKLLQELLAKYPSLLAGNQIDSTAPRRWLFISREAAIPKEENGAGWWSIDHLFLDQDAIPTLVEVKRSSDTRIRREVVGQMLDYAANAVVCWPIEAIRAKFESNCKDEGVNHEERLQDFLGSVNTAEEFWQKTKTNLQAGRVRLVFVADEIPAELRHVVEFLNSQMDPAEVLAVEIRQYIGQGLTSLVPRVIGQTAEAQQKKASGVREEKQWDEDSFFAGLKSQNENGTDLAVVGKKILDWATPRVTEIYWGRGTRTGSFVPILNHKVKDHQLFAVYTYGTVEIYFQHYKTPFDSDLKRKELRLRLNSIAGVSIPEDAIARRPGIPLSVLKGEAALKQFLETFDWFIEEVKAL